MNDVKYNNFVQLGQSLLTRIPQQEVPSYSHHSSKSEASKCLVCPPISMRSHAVYSFHMTTGGINGESQAGTKSSTSALSAVDFVHQIIR